MGTKPRFSKSVRRPKSPGGRVKTGRARLTAVRSRRAIPATVLRAALRHAGYLRRRKGVVGLSIGMRQRGQRWVAAEACISILVVDKIAADDLPARQALPGFIPVAMGGRTWQVPTDVRSTGGVRVGTCFGHVARPIDQEGQTRVVGGVSACVLTTTEPKFLISGHVAAAATNARLSVQGIPLTPERPVMTRLLDHCLARGELELSSASLPNKLAFKGIRSRASLWQGEVLFVYRATIGGMRRVTVRGVDADAPFRYATGDVRVYQLIATNAICIEGDSGCPLFDAEFRLVGTLLGGVTEDYYLPADYAFEKLSIRLPRL
jgi:hypothetical protein